MSTPPTPPKPKTAPSAYAIFAGRARARIRRSDPAVPSTEATRQARALWAAAGPGEREPFLALEREGKARHARELAAWEQAAGSERVEADQKNKEEGKKRKILEKAERTYEKSRRIEAANTARVAATELVEADLFTAPRRREEAGFKPGVPYFEEGDTVSVRGSGARPAGQGYVVRARGEGPGTVVDVAYLKACDECRPALPPGSFLHGISGDLGRVWRDVRFEDCTKSPICLPAGRGAARAKTQKTQDPKQPESSRTHHHEDPAGELAETLLKGWLREKLGLKKGKQLSTKEKDLFLAQHSLLKSRAVGLEKRRGGKFAPQGSLLGELPRAWGVSERYVSELRRQARGITSGASGGTLTHFPEKKAPPARHNSVIQGPGLARRVYTPARMYAQAASAT